MGHETETEESIRLAERFKHHAQTMDDFHNEMAGRDVGRISRFIGASASGSVESQKRRNERSAENTSFQIMMANAAYAALFEDTQNVLTDAQSRLDGLLERVQAQIEVSEAELADKLDRAASLPDGTKVFKDRNGDVRTQDGALVAAELAATVLWRGDEPSFEEVRADADRIERLNILADDIRAGQAEIGDMQAAMADESEVETSEELEGFKDRANEIVEGAEERLNAEISSAPAATPTPVAMQTSKVSVPEI